MIQKLTDCASGIRIVPKPMLEQGTTAPLGGHSVLSRGDPGVDILSFSFIGDNITYLARAADITLVRNICARIIQ